MKKGTIIYGCIIVFGLLHLLGNLMSGFSDIAVLAGFIWLLNDKLKY